MAKKELDRAINETGVYKAVDVQKLQSDGVRPPELPDINIDQVKHIISGRNAPRFFKK